MSEFMEEFMREMHAAFPKLLVQFEVRPQSEIKWEMVPNLK